MDVRLAPQTLLSNARLDGCSFLLLLLLLHETNESKVTLSKITVITADRDKLDRIGGSSYEGELGCVQREALTVLGLQLCAKGN